MPQYLRQAIQYLTWGRSGTTANLSRNKFPTGPLTIFGPQDQEIPEFYLVQEHRAPDFQTLKLRNPIGPFTILEPQDQEIGECYVVQERRPTDLEAPEL